MSKTPTTTDQFQCNCTLINTNNTSLYSNSRPEIWSCAYSPFQDLFAWSDRNGIVNIIDLKEQKSNLNKTIEQQGVYLINDVNDIKTFIHCGESVWSLAFGSAKSQVKHNRLHHKRIRRVNTRFDLNDLLILAVGLESGKIRIYDAVTRSFLFVLRDHKDVVRDLRFTKNGTFQLASVSRDETIKVRMCVFLRRNTF
jgi:WD40 repeat protein